MKTNGICYTHLQRKNQYEKEMKACIEQTVDLLQRHTTNERKPGMLLGKIQSGKTRTFIGVTGLAFDNGYDAVIVLTKGTKALAQQTYERLKEEYKTLSESDCVQVFDIMKIPTNLIAYELEQKLVFVVKKEIHNMKRLHDALLRYPQLKDRNVLIIDDEADYASLGFTKTQQETTEINAIAGQIDELRKELKKSAFLQVTATPYSLYLQPDELKVSETSPVFMPIKPAFTVLVPTPSTYIGSEYYFENEAVRKSLFVPIDERELMALKKPDRRRLKLEEVLTSKSIETLRRSVLSFLVGGVVRRIQQRKEGKTLEKYSFIIHTQQAKSSHDWQENVVLTLKERLGQLAVDQPVALQQMLEKCYEEMEPALESPPPKQDVVYEALFMLQKDYLLVTTVNSEKEMNQLLDEQGQLKLRAPLNIFIGGQILDRGITIRNLIGFYYGRNPRSFQQDTVLQHSRMFGYRSPEDLSVTKFYTTEEIYEVMEKIHDFDTGLRTAFEQGGQNRGVVFIEQDFSSRLIPCSPNKLLLSQTTTLKPLKRILPIGFQTGYKTYIAKTVKELDRRIKSRWTEKKPFLIDIEEAIDYVRLIKQTFDQQEGKQWDESSFIASMSYLSRYTNSKHKGKVWCVVRSGRNMSRVRANGRFEDAPDTTANGNSELTVAKKLAQRIPVLILLRQNGREENGWRGCPFWWPILVTPKNTKTVVFSRDLAKS
ncbi:Z1 domain-containing protein [Priestia koreensis]|uniref:Z1 domain-containing protein n=1 Tax=Priestia koreensis TaxID=284581 RepID=UPI001F590E03|nr:Z1 domain-containing protein [Priestia koreensis]UNL86542.1 hypothetical protein IE339_08665 [Priestia koreensis]